MGSSGSTANPDTNPDTKVENVKKLFNVEDEQDILESLNISDLKNNNKLPLPIIGGNDKEEEKVSNFFANNEGDIDFDLIGGGKKDPRFIARRRRYLRHNIFKILNDKNGFISK